MRPAILCQRAIVLTMACAAIGRPCASQEVEWSGKWTSRNGQIEYLLRESLRRAGRASRERSDRGTPPGEQSPGDT